VGIRNILRCLMALAVLLSAGVVRAEEPGETITWLYPIYPPAFMPEGPDKGTGILENTLTLIQQELPNYKHVTSVANMKRLLKSIKAERFVCSSLLMKTPGREKFIAFSKPYIMTHAYRIIVRAKDQKKFDGMTNKNGALSLRRLLENNGLRIGITEGRSYSPPVNAYLKKGVTEANSYTSTSHDLLRALLKMTAHRRIDYTIGYPVEITYLSRQMGMDGDFVSYAIAESAETYVAHVGCPKNQWGEKVIAALNPKIETLRLDERVYGAYMKWVDEPTGRQYKNMVLRRFGGEAVMAGEAPAESGKNQ